jgi:UDP:flavonoid glycosyltransferase YjiC (YdhE family)
VTGQRRARGRVGGEGVALAHVSRPLMLAAAAHARGYDVVYATDPRYAWVAADAPFERLELASLEPARFLAAVARGAPIFDAATLAAEAADDQRLLARVGPDVVVGDLRVSLSVSARLARVPYVAIANAYWSPYRTTSIREVPPLPATRRVPLPLANAAFRAVRRPAFARHALPLNRVRRRHGLPPIRYDVRYVYTDADHVGYADVPELFPLAGAPPTHHFLGPLVWSPPVALPPWWTTLPQDRPMVYVTLGSSGDPAQLPTIIAALAALPVTVVVASVEAAAAGGYPPNVHVARFLPGDQVSRAARLVVCNGGSPTSQQALMAGVPVLGVATNLDQILNMRAIERAGAGLLLRGDRLRAEAVTRAARRLLSDGAFRAAAAGLAEVQARYDAPSRFVALLDALTG